MDLNVFFSTSKYSANKNTFQNLDLVTSKAMHGPNVLETLLVLYKVPFSCSLKHFQVLLYINFVSAGHNISYK